MARYGYCQFLYVTNSIFFFFFFQAEDGIRDTSVTGVQTCALPICEMTRKNQPTYTKEVMSKG